MDAMRYRGLEVRQRYQWFQRWLLHKRSILMCKDGSSSAFIHTWFPTVVPPQRLSSMINSERIKFINWIIQHPRSRFFLGSGKSGNHQPGVDSEGLTMVPVEKEGLVGPTSGLFTSFFSSGDPLGISQQTLMESTLGVFKEETLPPFFWGHVGMSQNHSKPLYP